MTTNNYFSFILYVKFEQLLSLVVPYLLKEYKFRQPIGAKETLCVTLKHLISGDSHVLVGMSYRISPRTIGSIIKETCNVIVTRNFIISSSITKLP